MNAWFSILLVGYQMVSPSTQVVSQEQVGKIGGDVADRGKESKMEMEHVLLDQELETLILNQLDSKINDLEDIKVDAKILERHLDKHSNFSEYRATRNTLTSIENDLIRAYQKELSQLKIKIIASNHQLGSKDMKEINRMLDHAQVTVENSRDMIDSFIDVHMSSSEHQHEHDHGDEETHDDFADYADLITNNTEATKDEEKLLLETIEQELEDLTDVELHKEDLTDHLQEHQFINVNDDEVAKTIIDQVNVQDIHKHKEALLELRTQIKKSGGHLKLEFVDKVVSMLDRANIFVEISKDRLVTADKLDLSNDINSIVKEIDEKRTEGAEGLDDDDIVKINEEVILPVSKEPERKVSVEEISKDVTTDEKVELTDRENIAGEPLQPVDESQVFEIFEDVGMNTCLLLVAICLIILIFVIYLARKRISSVDLTIEQSDKFHEIGGICSPPPDDRTLYNPNNMFDTPKLSKVREASNNNNWNHDNTAEAYKRK